MSATAAPCRIEMDPAVRAILEADTPQSQLFRQYLRCREAILAADAAGIHSVVAPSRFARLEIGSAGRIPAVTLAAWILRANPPLEALARR